MTHEELVEKVCRGLARQHMTASGTSYVLDWSLFKNQAHTAIKIVGEACAADVPLIASQSEYGAKPATDSTMLTITAFKSAILSLTQGTKE